MQIGGGQVERIREKQEAKEEHFTFIVSPH
jgi:hypothetical protein